MEITHIVKRDFSIEKFDLDKITSAVLKAMQAIGRGSEESAQNVALMAYSELLRHKKTFNEYRPTIEQVQDIVETSLMKSNFPEVAKDALEAIHNKNKTSKTPASPSQPHTHLPRG